MPREKKPWVRVEVDRRAALRFVGKEVGIRGRLYGIRHMWHYTPIWISQNMMELVKHMREELAWVEVSGSRAYRVLKTRRPTKSHLVLEFDRGNLDELNSVLWRHDSFWVVTQDPTIWHVNLPPDLLPVPQPVPEPAEQAGPLLVDVHGDGDVGAACCATGEAAERLRDASEDRDE